MAKQTTPTKHCPGVLSLGLEAHDLPATGENFSTNKSMKDGYALRCRRCDGAYGKAWTAAKKAGTKFSARLEPAEVAAKPERTGPRVRKVAEIVQAVAKAEPAPEPIDPPQHLSQRGRDAWYAKRGRRPGWTTEQVGDTSYPLPLDEAVGTPEGQAALEALNRARDDHRRKLDAARKREQRARAKAAAAESDPGTESVRSLLRL